MAQLTESDRKTIRAVLQRQAERNIKHEELSEVPTEEINDADEKRRDLNEQADADLDELVPILTLLLTERP